MDLSIDIHQKVIVQMCTEKMGEASINVIPRIKICILGIGSARHLQMLYGIHRTVPFIEMLYGIQRNVICYTVFFEPIERF